MRQKKRQISFKECYAILEVDKSATLEDVKKAYRRRAFELHPDLNPGDPHAVRNFQLLNEAYVALSQVLQTQEAARAHTSADKARKEQEARQRDRDRQRAEEYERERERERAREREREKIRRAAAENAQRREQTAQAEAARERAAGEQGSGEQGTGEQDAARHTEQAAPDAASRAQARAASAAYGQEDVLRDLLNDPFARRVFEDIYSELNRQAQTSAEPGGQDGAQAEASAQPPPPPPPHEAPKQPASQKVEADWGVPRLNLDFSKGVTGVVKNWLRRQIDEEQTFVLPASSLRPGVRLRLQIRRGLSDDCSTIEVTLPHDFVIGKPVRLRGLGKKVGAWQGDLYLTFQAR